MPQAPAYDPGVPDRELPLRERKKRQTRSGLEDAALRLFAAHGFDNVTVEDIAAAAEVSARTFFRHFRSKDDVLFRDNEERLARLRDRLTHGPPGENPLTAVRFAVVALAEDYETARDALFVRTRVMAETPSLVGRNLHLQHEWEDVIARAVADRLDVAVDHDLRPRLVAACAMAAFRVASDAWLASGGKSHLPTMVDAAMQLVAGGADATVWTSGEGLRV